ALESETEDERCDHNRAAHNQFRHPPHVAPPIPTIPPERPRGKQDHGFLPCGEFLGLPGALGSGSLLAVRFGRSRRINSRRYSLSVRSPRRLSMTGSHSSGTRIVIGLRVVMLLWRK